MKSILIILTFLMNIVCHANTLENNTFDNSRYNNENKLSAAELKKMRTKNFAAHVTLEIPEGQLEGKHTFARKPNVSGQLIQINVKDIPDNSDDTLKNGAFYIGTMEANNSDYFIVSLSKNFTGLIEEGSYPSRTSSAPLIIKNRNKGASWKRAHGKVQTNNDITLTKVGQWLSIRGKRKVRRVEGNFTDTIEFDYNDANNLVKTETVTVKVSFSIMEAYKPKRS